MEAWHDYLMKNTYWANNTGVTQHTRDTVKSFSITLKGTTIDEDILMSMSILKFMSKNMRMSFGGKVAKTIDINMINAIGFEDSHTSFSKGGNSNPSTFFEGVWQELINGIIFYKFIKYDKFRARAGIDQIDYGSAIHLAICDCLTESVMRPIVHYLTNKGRYSNPLMGVSNEVKFVNIGLVPDSVYAEFDIFLKTQYLENHRGRIHQILDNDLRYRMDMILHMQLLDIIKNKKYEEYI